MKIEAAVRNARAFLKIQEEFGSFDSYCWRFVDGKAKRIALTIRLLVRNAQTLL